MQVKQWRISLRNLTGQQSQFDTICMWNVRITISTELDLNELSYKKSHFYSSRSYRVPNYFILTFLTIFPTGQRSTAPHCGTKCIILATHTLTQMTMLGHLCTLCSAQSEYKRKIYNTKSPISPNLPKGNPEEKECLKSHLFRTLRHLPTLLQQCLAAHVLVVGVLAQKVTDDIHFPFQLEII